MIFQEIGGVSNLPTYYGHITVFQRAYRLFLLQLCTEKLHSNNIAMKRYTLLGEMRTQGLL